MPELITLYAFLLTILIFHKQLELNLLPLLLEKDAYLLFESQDHELQIKRIRNLLFALSGLFAWPFLSFDIRFCLLIIGCAIYLWKQPYWSRRIKQRKRIAQLQFQFPIWLRQLQILIQTNTVHQALQLSMRTAPELIQHDLSKLIEETAEDAISIRPYLAFLSQYHLAEIERAMKLLYRYHTVGKEEAYQQLQRMIQTTAKWIRAERKERTDTRMLLYQWWGMLPLFGVTVMFMAVMFQIIIDLFGKGVS